MHRVRRAHASDFVWSRALRSALEGGLSVCEFCASERFCLFGCGENDIIEMSSDEAFRADLTEFLSKARGAVSCYVDELQLYSSQRRASLSIRASQRGRALFAGATVSQCAHFALQVQLIHLQLYHSASVTVSSRKSAPRGGDVTKNLSRTTSVLTVQNQAAGFV